ncbi:DUF488 domain-containing protein [Microvirga alba]|uniref:DUF488 domain-containing protein n=1 Tax=Microvirga alba TaxID=2791025 RepID=A0A931BY82_9HYPH|nr:DUF488 domain-containing protein [Microvirga alba]MBF9235007.1 DUF488 domain-containing protein [Microvirga alba]
MPVVYTIGYEGTDISRFVTTLNAVGVETLVDVRAVALSRKKGFSKTALRQHLEASGIRYEHLIGLGDPKDGREAARAGRYKIFERIYTNHLKSERAQEALSTLEGIVQDSVTCLMCFERDPKTCHRSIVVECLTNNHLVSFDLYGDDPDRYVRNRHLLQSRHSRQSSSTT